MEENLNPTIEETNVIDPVVEEKPRKRRNRKTRNEPDRETCIKNLEYAAKKGVIPGLSVPSHTKPIVATIANIGLAFLKK